MKTLFFIFSILLIIFACKPKIGINAFTKSITNTIKQTDTLRIANDSLEYEVIIIDPNFNFWLNSVAFPRNFYSLTYLENKNQIYVNEWNNRVMQPQYYNPDLYPITIDYNQSIKYGYEVNYLIYNYMIYFQNTFKQRLGGYVPMR